MGMNAAQQGEIHEMANVLKQDKNTAIILGGAHTLAFTEGAIVGDPIEKQCFEGIKFT